MTSGTSSRECVGWLLSNQCSLRCWNLLNWRRNLLHELPQWPVPASDNIVYLQQCVASAAEWWYHVCSLQCGQLLHWRGGLVHTYISPAARPCLLRAGDVSQSVRPERRSPPPARAAAKVRFCNGCDCFMVSGCAAGTYSSVGALSCLSRFALAQLACECISACNSLCGTCAAATGACTSCNAGYTLAGSACTGRVELLLPALTTPLI